MHKQQQRRRLRQVRREIHHGAQRIATVRTRLDQISLRGGSCSASEELLRIIEDTQRLYVELRTRLIAELKGTIRPALEFRKLVTANTRPEYQGARVISPHEFRVYAWSTSGALVWSGRLCKFAKLHGLNSCLLLAQLIASSGKGSPEPLHFPGLSGDLHVTLAPHFWPERTNH